MSGLDSGATVITGAGRGIGRALALALGAAGAPLVINDFDPEPARETAEAIVAAGGQAEAVAGDIADEAGAQAVVETALERFGRLHGLVNNAGILRDRMVFSMSPDEWDAVVRVHLRGHFLMTAGACRHWRAVAKEDPGAAGGRVVCMTSEAGLFGNPGQANYAAAKAGIVGFALVVAREMARYGVTSNAVAPRARTRMTEGAFEGFGNGDGPHPWDPENVAPLIQCLLDDDGEAYTGQIFVAGGGVLQLIEPYRVGAEIEVADGPAPHSDVAAFLADALGEAAGPPAFPDLGLTGKRG